MGARVSYSIKRSTLATTAAIQNSMQKLAASTRLGVKKRRSIRFYAATEFAFPSQTLSLSDSYPALLHLSP
eukprot:scaffold88791_cov65-Phaeocystis_antarctica.AAC.2